MKFAIGLLVVLLPLLGHAEEIIPPFGKDNLNYVNLTAHLTKRASCDDYHACVKFGTNYDCESEEANYVPTCAGNCYQYSSFNWVQVMLSSTADGSLGVSCNVYYDSYCQNYAGGAGDSWLDACTVYGSNLNSMICWSGC